MAGHKWPDEVRHDVARIVRDGNRQIWLSDTVTDPERAATDERYALGFLAGVKDGVRITGEALENLARGLYGNAEKSEDEGDTVKGTHLYEEADHLAALGGDLAEWDPGIDGLPERESKEQLSAFELRMKRWIDQMSGEATSAICDVLS